MINFDKPRPWSADAKTNHVAINCLENTVRYMDYHQFVVYSLHNPKTFAICKKVSQDRQGFRFKLRFREDYVSIEFDVPVKPRIETRFKIEIVEKEKLQLTPSGRQREVTVNGTKCTTYFEQYSSKYVFVFEDKFTGFKKMLTYLQELFGVNLHHVIFDTKAAPLSDLREILPRLPAVPSVEVIGNHMDHIDVSYVIKRAKCETFTLDDRDKIGHIKLIPEVFGKNPRLKHFRSRLGEWLTIDCILESSFLTYTIGVEWLPMSFYNDLLRHWISGWNPNLVNFHIRTMHPVIMFSGVEIFEGLQKTLLDDDDVVELQFFDGFRERKVKIEGGFELHREFDNAVIRVVMASRKFEICRIPDGVISKRIEKPVETDFMW